MKVGKLTYRGAKLLDMLLYWAKSRDILYDSTSDIEEKMSLFNRPLVSDLYLQNLMHYPKKYLSAVKNIFPHTQKKNPICSESDFLYSLTRPCGASESRSNSQLRSELKGCLRRLGLLPRPSEAALNLLQTQIASTVNTRGILWTPADIWNGSQKKKKNPEKSTDRLNTLLGVGGVAKCAAMSCV